MVVQYIQIHRPRPEALCSFDPPKAPFYLFEAVQEAEGRQGCLNLAHSIKEIRLFSDILSFRLVEARDALNMADGRLLVEGKTREVVKVGRQNRDIEKMNPDTDLI